MSITKKLTALLLSASLLASMASTGYASMGGDVGGGGKPQHSAWGIHAPDGKILSRSTEEEKLTTEEMDAYIKETGYNKKFGDSASNMIANSFTIKMRVGDTIDLHMHQGDYAMNDNDEKYNYKPYFKDEGVLGIEIGSTKLQGYSGSIETYCTNLKITADQVGESVILYNDTYSHQGRAYKVIVSENPRNADLKTLAYSIDGEGSIPVEGFKSNQLLYNVVLPLGASDLPLDFSLITLDATPAASTAKLDLKDATPEDMMASAKVTSEDGSRVNTYVVKFYPHGEKPTPPPDTDDSDDNNSDNSSGGSSGPSTEPGPGNTANAPETAEMLSETAAALKELGGGLTNAIANGKLPTGVTLEKSAGGNAMAAIPVTMPTNGAITLDMMGTLGGIGSNVGIKATIGSDAEVMIPGGFGKIAEVGRLYYPMTYKKDCDSQSDMLKAVKGEDVKSDTVQLGAYLTLPSTATLTIKTSLPNGSAVKMYCYNKETGKFVLIGTAKVEGGKIKFDTKQLGEFLFTTGTV